MAWQADAYSVITSWSNFLWSGPVLLFLVAVGLYQTWKLKGLQFFYLPKALKLSFELTSTKKNTSSAGDISAFQALMTSLAGSIGTGNITGIATGLTLGGVGALFWMWVMAFLGMATAYSETVLSLKYRQVNSDGCMAGGPMYTISKGLKSKHLACIYALIGIISTIGIGCLTQSNSMADAIIDVYSANRYVLGIVLAIITGAVVVGGVKSIGKVAGVIVPFMALVYLLSGALILLNYADSLIPAFELIISSAFSGQAAVGGFIGSSVALAMQYGAQYGIYANEAGLGSLSIAAASAKTKYPVEQGMRAMGGVFLATMVICTLTGLVIAVTQVIGSVDEGGNVITGTPLAMLAFKTAFPGLEYVVMLSLLFFAFTTMLAWAYYGEKCIEFLFGVKMAHIYRWLFTISVAVGAFLELKLVWAIASLATALMAIPNLIAIFALSKEVSVETKDYFLKAAKKNSIIGKEEHSLAL